MKNVLKYYYELEPENVHQINSNYRCSIKGEEYFLQNVENYDRDLTNLYNLNYYLLGKGFFCHQILLNVNKGVITIVNNVPYVLLKIFVHNRDTNIDDIKYFSGLRIPCSYYRNLDKSDWYKLWSHKIDYIEYQISQICKSYPIIRNSINYYIGLAENSISLLSNINTKQDWLVVSHRRINEKSKVHDLYNPINFILDSRVRDLSEFVKDIFFSDNIDFELIKKTVNDYKFNRDEAVLFFARMIFPTYYFDCYQEILFGNKIEKTLLLYIERAADYQIFLKNLYFFLRLNYDMPEIEWIIKT